MPNMSVIGRGATGIIYQLNEFVVVKKARKGEDEHADHVNEQKVFRFLESRPRIPYLIRCMYQVPNNTFLEFASNGSLAMLLNNHQKRNGGKFESVQILEISQTPTPHDTRRWMRQLCCAAAGFEKAGLAHGDIRPGNILLDSKWNLRLNDLDRSVKIGEDLVAVSEPFGRLLNHGKDAGTYGKASAWTENFAIGSVYYTLLRGHEPYETEYWGRDHFVIMSEKFQNEEFPPLTDSAEDSIVRKCWNGEYQSVKDLLAEFMDEVEQDDFSDEDEEWLMARRLECKEIVSSGVLDTLEGY